FRQIGRYCPGLGERYRAQKRRRGIDRLAVDARIADAHALELAKYRRVEFRMANDEPAAGAKRIPKPRDRVLDQVNSEVDHQIAAHDQVERIGKSEIHFRREIDLTESHAPLVLGPQLPRLAVALEALLPNRLRRGAERPFSVPRF